ncbi:hypothetical protein [Puia sp.]|uniref:hypothetical protein n=1 Tax=Puia sp. TaxID=2045100 RepID=UPI002F40524B
MQPSNSSIRLAVGQCYRVNSFDLGFINVHPIELLVEIKHLDPEANELEFSVLPLSTQDPSPALIAIAKWFGDVYPTRTKDDCLLKNARAFDHLVDQGIAVLHHASHEPKPEAPRTEAPRTDAPRTDTILNAMHIPTTPPQSQ